MVQRVSSVDSLDQTDLISSMSDSLRCLTSYHQWIHNDEKIRVEKVLVTDDHHRHMQMDSLASQDKNDDEDEDSFHPKTFSISDFICLKKAKIFTTTNTEQEEEEEEEEIDHDPDSLAPMDISYTHFNVQLQVNHGQLERATRSGIFSSSFFNPNLPKKINRFKTNQSSQTMPMEYDGHEGNGNSNGYSSTKNGHTRDDGSSRRDRQQHNHSSGNSNGSNPNRNNNNSRR